MADGVTTREKKDLYAVGEIPPDLHVPKNMHAWAIRRERQGRPKQAMQLEVVPTPEIASDEVLVLLHHAHPDSLTLNDLLSAMDRRADSTTRKAAKELWHGKLVDGEAKNGYRLTSRGFERATSIVAGAASA